MRRIAAAVLFVFSLVCCLTRPMLAQEGSATLTGFIQDSSKAVISGVKVTAIETNTNQRFEATTGKDGSYTIVSLPVGPYQVQIEKPGFKTILKDDLFLHTQDALEVNFQMAVGSTSETVMVNGATTNDSPAVSMTVTQDFVENMPLNGRSFQDLISLAPGTVSSASGNGLYSINGQRDDANNFTVDGVSANTSSGIAAPNSPISSYAGSAGALPAETALATTQSLASVDTMQEFQIQTSGYAAEFGRQPGGQFAISTRSGTNAFHGTAFDYLRNEAFDANSWFDDHSNPVIPKLKERQNDFGGTFGGPVTVPGIYKGKDRTFFFLSFEGLRLILPWSFTNLAVPTSTFRQQAAPAIQPFLDILPLPNGQPVTGNGVTPGVAAYYSAGISTPSNLNNWSAKLDQNLGAGTHLFARYAATRSSAGSLTEPSAFQNSFVSSNLFTIGLTKSLTRLLTDELRFNYTTDGGFSGITLASKGGAIPIASDLVVPSQLVGSLEAEYFVAISLAKYGVRCCSTLSNYTGPSRQQSFNVVDSLSWVHASHALKAGVDYRRLLPFASLGSYESYSSISSTGAITQGYLDNLYVTSQQPSELTFYNLSLYAQDHWKISPRLSVDYGLRWELNPGPGSQDGVLPLAVNEITSLSAMALEPRGTSLYKTRFDNFAPRFGFAYQLRSSQRLPTIIRGGVGMFYDTGQSQSASGGAEYPFYIQTSATDVPLPLSQAALVAPSLNTPLVPPYGYLNGIVDPNLRMPYTEQWNLSLDQGLGAKSTLTMSYVANSGHRLLALHQYYLSSINPNFTTVNIVDNQAASSYNALQVQGRGLVLSGVQVLASYTWAHAIDNESTDQEYLSIPLIRGNSDNDVRQVFNLASNWKTPEHPQLGTVFSAISRDWIWSTRFLAQSGMPSNISGNYYTDPANGGTYSIPALIVPGVNIYEHDAPGVPGSWRLNPAAFTSPSLDANGLPLELGPRNYIHGPNFWTLNTAIQRDFRVFERVRAVARVEAFNVFNHPNFQGIENSLLDGSLFGTLSAQQSAVGVQNGDTSQLNMYGTGNPRSLQLALKITF
jgi:hypothetical protein